MSRAVARITVPLVLVAAMAATIATSPPAQAEQPPGTRPTSARMALTAAPTEGLLVTVNERGHISRSIAGAVSDGGAETVAVTKPAGARQERP